jgi:TolA-binding protein
LGWKTTKPAATSWLAKSSAEYVKFYFATDQAGQAQYYLADSEYWSGDYHAALNDFDKLEQQYPQTDAASVELKSGLSLTRLGNLDDAHNVFLRLIERYPNSVEAMDARSALSRLDTNADLTLSNPKH